MMDLDDGVSNRKGSSTEADERRQSAYVQHKEEAHPLLSDSGLETN
jgi:hypothetical protein